MPWPAVPRMVDLWDVAIQKLGFLANPSFTLRSPSAVRKSASDDRFTAGARLRGSCLLQPPRSSQAGWYISAERPETWR